MKYVRESYNEEKILVVFMVLVMFITSVLCLDLPSISTMANENDWTVSGIILPKEDSLVGAGYIEIEFSTLVPDAKSYQVYFDNQPIYEKDGQVVRSDLNENIDDATVRIYDAKKCEDTVKCEVYTTDVAKHTTYVIATLEDDTVIKTNERSFYVSKKDLP